MNNTLLIKKRFNYNKFIQPNKIIKLSKGVVKLGTC